MWTETITTLFSNLAVGVTLLFLLRIGLMVSQARNLWGITQDLILYVQLRVEVHRDVFSNREYGVHI